MAVIFGGEAEEFGAVRVDFDVVKGGERVNEMVKVLSAMVVDAKVINYQAEGYLAGVVLSLLLIGLEKHEKCISDFFEA